jgi:hypothetical protein
MKSPPRQIVDDEAHELIERFITKNARKATAPAGKKTTAPAS